MKEFLEKLFPSDFMTRENPAASPTRTVVQRFGLAVLSVAIALGVANVMYYYLQVKNGEIAILLIAIAVTVWFAGNWPGVLAIVLAILGFDYFFLPPFLSPLLHKRGHSLRPGVDTVCVSDQLV